MQNIASIEIGYIKPKLTKYNSLEYDHNKAYSIFNVRQVTFFEGGGEGLPGLFFPIYSYLSL